MCYWAPVTPPRQLSYCLPSFSPFREIRHTQEIPARWEQLLDSSLEAFDWSGLKMHM